MKEFKKGGLFKAKSSVAIQLCYSFRSLHGQNVTLAYQANSFCASNMWKQPMSPPDPPTHPSSVSSLSRVTGECPVSAAFQQQAGYTMHKLPAQYLKPPIRPNSQMCIFGRKLRKHICCLFQDCCNDETFSMSIGKVRRKADQISRIYKYLDIFPDDQFSFKSHVVNLVKM